MNILWITNILLPEAVSLLNGENVLRGSGGWMIGAANELLKRNNINLYVASPTKLVSELKVLEGERVMYYVVPMGKGNVKYNPAFEPFWKEIQRQVSPDIVHIHGTEFSHGLAYIRACGAEHVVASIQGLMSEISKYCLSGVPIAFLLRNITFYDICYNKTLWNEKKKLQTCGRSEAQLIRGLGHVIGRTTWDKSHVWAINNNIHYHLCNETLRPEFYEGRWDYKACKKQTIFVSQPKNSIKGFHQLLKALSLVLKRYPNTVVRIPGTLQLFPTTIKGKMLQSGYNRFLKELVIKNGLKDHLVFLGLLSAEEMKREYLSAHVFVSCSSIENSSNSIGEAQLLGTPCISSYVGGCNDMVKHEETGFLYRFEETEMLAYYICKVFGGEYDLTSISQNEVNVAKLRHDPIANCNALMEIYNKIAEKS